MIYSKQLPNIILRNKNEKICLISILKLSIKQNADSNSNDRLSFLFAV